MIKKNIKAAIAAAICTTIMTGNLAYAATSTFQTNCNTVSKSSHDHGDRWKYNTEILNQLGLTKEDIENAEKSGKTLFEIAKVKGHSEEEVKKIVMEERIREIDAAVSSGKLTKEKGEEIKVKIKEKIQNWDGCLNHEKKEHKFTKLKE